MAESKQLELGDIHLHYVEAPGPGPVLLLLHGVTGSLESYLPLLPKLSSRFHVYAIDFRGHGESSHTPNNYSLRLHVDDIKRFIDALIGAPVFIASHSMGACVGGWFAALYPKMVRGLILEDQGFEFPPDVKTTGFVPRRNQLIEMHALGTTFEEAVTIFGTEPTPEDKTKTRFDVYGPEGVQLHARQWLQMDVTHLDSGIEGKIGAGWDAKEILSHIMCPTLLIMTNQWNDDEAILDLQLFKDNVEHGQHIVIDVPNHRIHEMYPDKYLDAVEGFLKPLIAA